MQPAEPRPKRIAYQPYVVAQAEKGYAVRMRESLARFGTVVPWRGTWAAAIDGLRSGRGRLDCLILNWTDNDLLDRRSRRVAARKVVKLFAKTIAMRLATRRLVFVRHNVYPHAVAAGHEADAQRWVDRYERLFDAVVTHSGDDSQRTRLYCPHPLYRRVEAIVDSSLARTLPARYFVVFGRIVRYKQLERLMTGFPVDQTLLVIGAIGDRAYADELAGIDRANVLFRPGLLDEAEAQTIVARSAGLLISHADGDVVVSASFFFAMSLGVPVLAVATPFLRWIAPRLGVLLALADDLAGLCEIVADRPVVRISNEDRAAIEQAFGDAAVHTALRLVLAG
jgi:glycosyltransferase involved in cell wall biosynthesis